MTPTWDADKRRRIDSAIRVLCPIIHDRVTTNARGSWTEEDLRKELVACILGSQVRHEMAVAAMQNLEFAGLLDDDWWQPRSCADFTDAVYSVLSGKRDDLPDSRRYRFPRVRADQLGEVRDRLARRPLMARLALDDIGRLRCCLISELPGLGPKQASMFLRNVGKTYDLAILDTHVLRFMDMHAAIPSPRMNVGTVARYEEVERSVVDYADSLGYPAGYLDWAIWATMKAARELAL